jgi:hypothetical protein
MPWKMEHSKEGGRHAAQGHLLEDHIWSQEHDDNAAHVNFLVKNEGRQLGEVKKQKKYFWKFAA